MRGTSGPRGIGGGAASRSVALAVLILCVVTIAAFSPVVSNGLVNWDDAQLLLQNDRYRGLSLEHLSWMFRTNLGGHYQPLTWVSFAVDYLVWGGVSPLGFHLTNLLLHCGVAVLVLFLARRLIALTCMRASDLSALVCALISATVFAVHPLRVESVAWATERRDVLSGVFILGAVLFYVRSVGASGVQRRVNFAVSVTLFILSLLAKAAGIVLPAVLLVLDVYPLRRLGLRPKGVLQTTLARLLLEKVWFFVPAAVFAVIAGQAQSGAGAMWSLELHPLGLRMSQAFYGVLFYLGKTIWPADLVPLYEQPPGATPFDATYVVSIVGVVLLSVLLVLARKRWPALLAGWICYVVFLAPVLGLAQSGPQLVADRYSYLACIPWAVIVGGAASLLLCSASSVRKRWVIAAVGAFAFVSSVLVGLTRAQVGVWRDSRTLWETVIRRRPQTGLAYANLAAVELDAGETASARSHAERALEILPGNLSAHQVLGRSALQQGDFAVAERHLRAAYEISRNLGRDDAATALTLASALTQVSKRDEARALYRDLVSRVPGDANVRLAFGGFLASGGDLVGARAQFEECVRLAPSFTIGHLRLGIVERMLGNAAAAMDAFEAGLAASPDDPTLQGELAWLLATAPDANLRDGKRAVALAGAAIKRTKGMSIRAWEAMAAGQAETGAFSEAVQTVERVLDDLAIPLSQAQRERFSDQLASYREGLLIRE